jgi:hypothetical protein
MANVSGKSSPSQNINTYINAQVNMRANRGDVQFLLKKLKDNKRKENNGKFIFLISSIGIFVISGIIFSL